MHLLEIILACGMIIAGQAPDEPGVIRGRVVNMSQREAPCAAEVLLRARMEDQFVPVAETQADAEGNYRFEGLPVGSEYLYLPGANRNDIHYPGRRVQLTRGHPTAYVTLEVHDTAAEPNPLVIRQHEIVMATEPGAVHVVEALLVDNPTLDTYVGMAKNKSMPPVTLELHIPADFERVTFEQERFGREFQVIDGRLVTGIPWTPGQQWLRFTYTLRNTSGELAWKRTLDAPCESVRVRVKDYPQDEITCNLPPETDEPAGEVVFQSAGAVLPAGHAVHIRLGNSPVPWSVYGRWVAVLALAGLIAGASLVVRRSSRQPASDDSEGSTGRAELLQPGAHDSQTSRSPRRDRSGRAA